jgi:hypothetical protein
MTLGWQIRFFLPDQHSPLSVHRVRQQLMLRVQIETFSRLMSIIRLHRWQHARRCCVVAGHTIDQSKSTLIYGLIFQGEASDHQRGASIER